MAKTLTELHDHLKSTGTGRAKLELVLASESIDAAVAALLEKFPGTHAKAVKFLEGAPAPAPAKTPAKT